MHHIHLTTFPSISNTHAHTHIHTSAQKEYNSGGVGGGGGRKDIFYNGGDSET